MVAVRSFQHESDSYTENYYTLAIIRNSIVILYYDAHIWPVLVILCVCRFASGPTYLPYLCSLDQSLYTPIFSRCGPFDYPTHPACRRRP